MADRSFFSSTFRSDCKKWRNLPENNLEEKISLPPDAAGLGQQDADVGEYRLKRTSLQLPCKWQHSRKEGEKKNGPMNS
jgi:hypothetical protein